MKWFGLRSWKTLTSLTMLTAGVVWMLTWGWFHSGIDRENAARPVSAAAALPAGKPLLPRPKMVPAPKSPLPDPPDKETVRRLCRLLTARLDAGEGGEIPDDLAQMWELTSNELAQCRKAYAALFEKFCALELAASRKVTFNGEWIDLLPVEGASELMEKLEKDLTAVLGPSRGLGLSAMLAGVLRDGGTRRMQICYWSTPGEETWYRGLCFSQDGKHLQSNIKIRDANWGQKPRWRHLDKFLSAER